MFKRCFDTFAIGVIPSLLGLLVMWACGAQQVTPATVFTAQQKLCEHIPPTMPLDAQAACEAVLAVDVNRLERAWALAQPTASK